MEVVKEGPTDRLLTQPNVKGQQSEQTVETVVCGEAQHNRVEDCQPQDEEEHPLETLATVGVQ